MHFPWVRPGTRRRVQPNGWVRECSGDVEWGGQVGSMRTHFANNHTVYQRFVNCDKFRDLYRHNQRLRRFGLCHRRRDDISFDKDKCKVHSPKRNDGQTYRRVPSRNPRSLSLRSRIAFQQSVLVPGGGWEVRQHREGAWSCGCLLDRQQ